MKGGKGGGGG